MATGIFIFDDTMVGYFNCITTTLSYGNIFRSQLLEYGQEHLSKEEKDKLINEGV
jgi:hypothetical protein